MKIEKAIQVLRDFNLWRRGNEEMEQPDPHTIGEAIDDVLMAIGDMEMEAELYRGTINGWEDKWKCTVELAANARAELEEERKEGEEQRDRLAVALDVCLREMLDVIYACNEEIVDANDTFHQAIKLGQKTLDDVKGGQP
jgi:hypothetical protein